jgi:hypothetical protein
MPGIWVASHVLCGVATLPWNRWQDSRGISGRIRVEWPAAFVWNQWQLSRGISGRLAVESVAAFAWNRWQDSRGIRTEAIRDGAPATDLVDGQELGELLKHYELGVSMVVVDTDRFQSI